MWSTDVHAGPEYCYWQEESGELFTVLQEVFAWLTGRELAACGPVCRAWRQAARDSRLWRHLLQRMGVTTATLRALRDHYPTISWRQEYVNVCAGWKSVARFPEGESDAEEVDERLPGRGGALLTHAAADSNRTRVALAADDGTLSIWEQTDMKWQEEWTTDLRLRGWSGAVRSEWTKGGAESVGSGGDSARLLVTGALALADRWELLVLQRDEYGEYRSQARAGCSAGAGGCWAGGDVFLSLELCRLAPRLAMTIVWLNAATQETQSEYTGVTSPLLRIFNEDSAHLTHALVADVPLEAMRKDGNCINIECQLSSPGPDYYIASADTEKQRSSEESVQTLVTASQGESGALRTWGVSARRPPPLRAADAGSLAARARRHRAAAAAPPPDPDEPDEATVRAMCDPPDAECYLHAAVLGLVLHSNNKCMWASTADGRAWCVSLPALTRLCILPGAPGEFPNDPYYIQPAVSAHHVATPAACSRGGRVRVWSALSGAPCPRPPKPPRQAVSSLVCLTSTREDVLLVLTGQYIYVSDAASSTVHPQYSVRCDAHRNKTSPLSAPRRPAPYSMALRMTLESIARFAQPPSVPAMRVGCRSAHSAPAGKSPCSGPPPPRPCQCQPKPRPPCRARPQDRMEALVVTCCPPSTGKRPPCPPCPPKPPLTCNRRKLSTQNTRDPTKSCIPSEPLNSCGKCCGNENDRVERRMAAEERVRREDYEREAAERCPQCCHRPEPVQYCLGSERTCERATDGRQYAVLCGTREVPRCGACRRPPPPQCVELMSDGPCKIQGANNMNPCAHRRRTLLQIDRSQSQVDGPEMMKLKGGIEMASATSARISAQTYSQATSQSTSQTRGLGSSSGQTVPRQQCDKNCDAKSCEIKRSKPLPAPPCQLPTVAEALRERASGPCACETSCSQNTRSYHTSAIHNITKRNSGNKLSTNKLISASAPNVKIIMMNRATSPFIKHMSDESYDGKKKSGSWASFEKLRKVCVEFGSGKKKVDQTSSPCGAKMDTTTMIMHRVPPNPCAPTKPDNKSSNKQSDSKKQLCSSKQATNNNQKQPPNPCTSKQGSACTCDMGRKGGDSKQENKNPCGGKQGSSSKSSSGDSKQGSTNVCGAKGSNPCICNKDASKQDSKSGCSDGCGCILKKGTTSSSASKQSTNTPKKPSPSSSPCGR